MNSLVRARRAISSKTPLHPFLYLSPPKLTQLKPHQNPSRVLPVRDFSSQTTTFPEFEMPTVTWGVLLGRKEKLVSKVIICDYLKGLGVITDELEDLELPSTIEVMKERVEFIERMGLTIDDINQYPLMLGCSVRKNMIPVLGYLEKLGFQRSKLGEFVKSYPQVLHASVVVDLLPVVKYLRGLDVSSMDAVYVLNKYPELFGFKIDGTMATSAGYLVSIGVNPRDIGPMIMHFPYFLGMRVATRIKPIVDFLVSLGLPKKILAKMIEKRPYILGYDLKKTVEPSVSCLTSFGVSKEALPRLIAQYPQILGMDLQPQMASQNYFFNLKLKIDSEGFARVMEKMPQVVVLEQSMILRPFEFLVERGISPENVAKMIIQCPQLITVRTDRMKNSLYFFKSEMGRPFQELVDFPEYFTYSLESRIKPRFYKLQSKGIRYSLNWFLNCSDLRFEERLDWDCVESETPGPSFTMGGRLELPSSESVSEDEDEDDNVNFGRKSAPV